MTLQPDRRYGTDRLRRCNVSLHLWCCHHWHSPEGCPKELIRGRAETVPPRFARDAHPPESQPRTPAGTHPADAAKPIQASQETSPLPGLFPPYRFGKVAAASGTRAPHGSPLCLVQQVHPPGQHCQAQSQAAPHAFGRLPQAQDAPLSAVPQRRTLEEPAETPGPHPRVRFHHLQRQAPFPDGD